MSTIIERRPRRTRQRMIGDRESQAIVAALGREVHAWRKQHALTLRQLGAKVGIGTSRMADLEAGRGATAPVGLWIALGIAIGRPLGIAFSRAIEASVRDAGHLAIQELILRLARARGVTRFFDLTTRSLRSIDVGLRDEIQRVLILIEIWNRMDDMGAAVRDSSRKLAEVRDLAGVDDLRIASCWVIRATAANRALVARYPNVFETAFPGSSRAWVRVLTEGGPVPAEPGLVWADVAGTRLFEWRRR